VLSSNYSTPRNAYLLALAAGIAAYANAFHGVFQFDDFNVIVASARVHAWSAWLEAAGHGGLRPLLNLSYTFSWVTGGGDPFSFHLFNLLVHLVNIGLVYALAGNFMRRHNQAVDWRPAAVWAALLFAVHPVHSEAITYLCGRSTALMTLLYLATLWCYAHGNRAYRTASLGLFVLAVLTKESALLFPLALLAWDWSSRTPWRVMLKRQWPYWMLCALATLALMLHPAYWSLMWNSVHSRDLYASLPTQLNSSFSLLGELAWPAALNFDPDWPVLTDLTATLPQLVILTVCLLLAWRLRATRPWISLGVLWVLLHLLLPNIFFPRADVANERQLYWADWGLFLIVGVELQLALSRRTAWVAIAVVAGVLAVLTHARNTVYASEIALWEDTAGKSPHKARVFNNLGYSYQQAGRNEAAKQAYLKALVLQPDFTKAANNLDRINRQTGP